MELFDFGKRSGLQVPRANIGGMRLPQDDDEAVELIRFAIDSGMRYIDTSRGYGDSEVKIGKALKGGYRQKVILSTKWSPWVVKIEDADDASADCTRRRIEESMRRLDVDYLDFYQVWNINRREAYDQAVAPGGMVEGILRCMDEGMVGHTGFTTHDTVENLLVYIDEADWCEVMLFTYNLLSRSYAPALAAAHAKGIGTIVMNPVAGGKLTEPSTVLLDLARRVDARSVPDLALRFLLTQPAVDAIVSGISRASDVADTVAAVEAGPFSPELLDRIDDFLERRLPKNSGYCTRCGYCMPCPQGIDIPLIMNLVAEDTFWGFTESARRRYQAIEGPDGDACTQCRQCEERCTQSLAVVDEMKCAADRFRA